MHQKFEKLVASSCDAILVFKLTFVIIQVCSKSIFEVSFACIVSLCVFVCHNLLMREICQCQCHCEYFSVYFGLTKQCLISKLFFQKSRVNWVKNNSINHLELRVSFILIM